VSVPPIVTSIPATGCICRVAYKYSGIVSGATFPTDPPVDRWIGTKWSGSVGIAITATPTGSPDRGQELSASVASDTAPPGLTVATTRSPVAATLAGSTTWCSGTSWFTAGPADPVIGR
jgi:hypothetical protein